MNIDGYYTDNGLLEELLVARNLNFENVNIARKNYIQLIKFIQDLYKENDLLKEELTNLKNDITRVYNTMISLETINKQELEEIEEM